MTGALFYITATDVDTVIAGMVDMALLRHGFLLRLLVMMVELRQGEGAPNRAQRARTSPNSGTEEVGVKLRTTLLGVDMGLAKGILNHPGSICFALLLSLSPGDPEYHEACDKCDTKKTSKRAGCFVI